MSTVKEAFGEGVQDALRDYGVLPKKEPSLLRKAAPWLAAAAAGGLGYKYLRTPSFAKNPALRKIQQEAAQKGFHRVVDVSHPGAFVPNPEEGVLDNLLGRAGHWWKPKVNPTTGELPWLDKRKLYLQEGGEAIPVASNTKGKMWVPGEGGNAQVKGIVAGRHVEPEHVEKPMSKVVRGGQDIEGPLETQKALTEVSTLGKGHEADLMQRYAPEAFPESLTNLEPHFRGLQTGTPEQRQRAVFELRKRLQGHFGGRFALKPVQGLQSGGEFPWSEENWGAHLGRFERHLANPKHLAAYQKAEKEGLVEMVGYLRDRDLLQGHTLHTALKDPASVMAQRAIPNPMGEWRVHTINGAAPAWTMTPRHSQVGLGDIGAYMNLGGVKTREMQQFVEDALRKFPKKYRQGAWGFDVMPFKKPDGSTGYQILEMNPTERQFRNAGGGYSAGGGSGLLDSTTVPGIGHMHYRAATGRHTPLVAAGLAAPLAIAAGSGTERLLDENS